MERVRKNVEAVNPDDQEEMSLRRFYRSQTEPCVHCPVDLLKPNQLILSIEFRTCFVTLCPTCEAELLSRLLANYLRRKRREKANDEIPPLWKDIEDPDDDSDMEWLAYAGRDDD